MEARVQNVGRGTPLEPINHERAAAHAPAPVPAGGTELHCRVCELETENTRLRVLVGELLVANQRLRERAATARNDEQAA